ncbi:hypothetical protein FOZ60_002821 [Perkinsus olseni]|uniref:Uncharacterized protein n=1 Tax=Perkinsus olseni TaxID=32597 RepID=A0A7J6NY42_PEROL|nr:hypothetical protein FOZ60_002821 [Perkinsus olseni]
MSVAATMMRDLTVDWLKSVPLQNTRSIDSISPATCRYETATPAHLTMTTMSTTSLAHGQCSAKTAIKADTVIRQKPRIQPVAVKAEARPRTPVPTIVLAMTDHSERTVPKIDIFKNKGRQRIKSVAFHGHHGGRGDATVRSVPITQSSIAPARDHANARADVKSDE